MKQFESGKVTPACKNWKKLAFWSEIILHRERLWLSGEETTNGTGNYN